MGGELAQAGDIYTQDVYEEAYENRITLLTEIRSKPQTLADAKAFYRDHCAEFISDFMDTFDPRRLAAGQTAEIPFRLFPRQVDFVTFVRQCIAERVSGLVEKSRDTGCTWLACGIAVWLFCFWPGASIGFGSRKADLVDRLGDAKSIFEKLRIAMRSIPPEFFPQGFDINKGMSYMRITNPATGNTISGESGDNIGRGDRTLVYFVDEAAWLERPEIADAALSDTTHTRIDISSVSGTGTPFHRKREGGQVWEPGRELSRTRTNLFIFDWTHHPAKTSHWHEERRQKAVNDGVPHVFAQEVDRDYTAALSRTLIRREWVDAATDLHKVLPALAEGGCIGGFDVADEGKDMHAFCVRRGLTLVSLAEWGGGDAGKATRSAIGMVNGHGPVDVQYDSVGVGSAAKAEYNRLVEERLMPPGVTFNPWNAGGKVLHPHKRVIPEDHESARNSDFFDNLKAQAWWSLRNRLERCHRYRLHLDGNPDGADFEADELMSIDSGIGKGVLSNLVSQLCQVQGKQSARLKTMIDKQPDGARSPNSADAVVMAYFPLPKARRSGTYDFSGPGLVNG